MHVYSQSLELKGNKVALAVNNSIVCDNTTCFFLNCCVLNFAKVERGAHFFGMY